MSNKSIASVIACTAASLLLSACSSDGDGKAQESDPTATHAEAVSSTPEIPHGDCLDGITDFAGPGPFEFTMEDTGTIKFWVPTVPAGCKVPVVHLANGTLANCGFYSDALERLASHGFLTACYEDPQTGAGAYGMEALETALAMYPELADNKFGSTGHSQGGQAAIVTVALAEEKYGSDMRIAGLAMEPASGYGAAPEGRSWQEAYGKVTSPIFMFSGDSQTGFDNASLSSSSTGDGLVSIKWVQLGFEKLPESTEAYHWTNVGGVHIPTPQEAEMATSIPWFRWKLLGDRAACEHLMGLTSGDEWYIQAEKNVSSCD